MDDVTAEQGISMLVPPDSSRRNGERPGWTGGRYSFMRRVLGSELGAGLYRQRKHTVEPVFAHTKHNRHINRTEWRLILMTHNLTKLHRHHLAPPGPETPSPPRPPPTPMTLQPTELQPRRRPQPIYATASRMRGHERRVDVQRDRLRTRPASHARERATARVARAQASSCSSTDYITGCVVVSDPRVPNNRSWPW